MDYLLENGIKIIDYCIIIDLYEYNFKKDKKIMKYLLNNIDINKITHYKYTIIHKISYDFKLCYLYLLMTIIRDNAYWSGIAPGFLKKFGFIKLFKFIKNKIILNISYLNSYVLFYRIGDLIYSYSPYKLNHLLIFCKIMNIHKNLKYSVQTPNNTKYYKIRKLIIMRRNTLFNLEFFCISNKN